MPKQKKLPYTESDISLFISKFSTGRVAFQNEPSGNKCTYSAGEDLHLTTDLVKKHLDGDLTIGSHVLTSDSKCKFCVLDFDISSDLGKIRKVSKRNELIAAAKEELRETVGNCLDRIPKEVKLDRNQFILEDSGNKGYHIWFFFETEISSEIAWKFVRAIAYRLGVSDIERFPKQASLGEHQWGSLIKLPLGIHKKTHRRCIFLDNDFEPIMDVWTELSNCVGVSINQINNILKLMDTEDNHTDRLDSSVDISEYGSIDRMVEQCVALQGIYHRSQHPSDDGDVINLTHDERKALMCLFSPFGSVGISRVHEWLKNCNNYDYNKTQNVLLSAKTKPIRCDTLRDMGICPKECSNIVEACGKSPIKLAFDPAKSGKMPIIVNRLGEIENPVIAHKRVKVHFYVESLAGNPYYSIKKVNFEKCNEDSCPKYSKCPCLDRDKEKVVKFSPYRKEHISLMGMSSDKVTRLIKSRVRGCINTQALRQQNGGDQITVQPFVAANLEFKTDFLGNKPEEGKATTKEDKNYLCYFLGNSLQNSKKYVGTGIVLPNPINREITILFDRCTEVFGATDNFQVTENNIGIFKKLQKLTVKDYVEDIGKNIISIIERDDVILSMLLTYCSVMEMVFNKVHLKKGWVEMAMVGDSGQAKSEIVERFMDYVGLGSREQSNVSVAGLIGGIDKIAGQQLIHWGAFPRNDKGLLFVDEVQNWRPEVWPAVRQVRSEGVASITKIKHGHRNARCRLIAACNPHPGNREMSSFKYGCQALASVFKQADIRRFDIACFLSNKDFKAELLNKINKGKKARITPEMFQNLFMWAWSRAKEDIIFEDDVTQEILDSSNKLSELFGSSSTVPLCNNADMREKLARLVVGLAVALVHTDSTYKLIIPTVGDVKYITNLLISMYSRPRVALDKESKYSQKLNEVDDTQKKEILDQVAEKGFTRAEEIIECLVDMEKARANELALWVNCTVEEVTKVLTLLTKYHMVELGKAGAYVSKPKLGLFYKILETDKNSKIFEA